jgi:hypothetical protein
MLSLLSLLYWTAHGHQFSPLTSTGIIHHVSCRAMYAQLHCSFSLQHIVAVVHESLCNANQIIKSEILIVLPMYCKRFVLFIFKCTLSTYPALVHMHICHDILRLIDKPFPRRPLCAIMQFKLYHPYMGLNRRPAANATRHFHLFVNPVRESCFGRR